MGIGEKESEELDWGKTSNLCVAWKVNDDDDDDDDQPLRQAWF